MHNSLLHLTCITMLLTYSLSGIRFDDSLHKLLLMRQNILSKPQYFALHFCANRYKYKFIKVSWRIDQEWMDICEAQKQTKHFERRYWQLIVFDKYEILGRKLVEKKFVITLFR